MSKTIDEKVVSMQFDNKQFEQNVQTSLSTLDKLKKALHLEGASKGLEDINSAVGKFDISPLTAGVETVKEKFSALEIMAVTALVNITNSAVNAGKELVKSLSVDQITAGWSKYEEKTASVQTLINSTGKGIDEINGYLSKLMWFSDETSYSFTDMTSALAQMTSSGGDIDKLMPMITGIANATAFAGKGSAEFSSTIRNLAQSYQAGFLQLQDMKSLNLMGTSSKQLKETFISIAESLGKIKKGTVTLENFDTTLKDKWADTEVMEKALSKFSELSEAAYEAVSAGEYDTAAEAIEALSKDFDNLAVRAFKSAQEAKTFKEAIDATKDAVSSGWLASFEIIFGNYEEAKVLWTDLANAMWDTFASGAEARNELLQEWKDLGGRDDLIGSFWNIWESVGEIIAPIKEAFRDIFPPMTASRLKELTSALYDFTEKLKISDERSASLRDTFKGVFSIFDMFKKVVSGIGKAVSEVFNLNQASGFFGLILDSFASIGRYLTDFNESFTADQIADNIKRFLYSIKDGIATSGFGKLLSDITTDISSFIGIIIGKFKELSSGLPSVGDTITGIFSTIWNGIKTVFGYLKDNISGSDIFAVLAGGGVGLAGGGIFALAKKIGEVVKTIKQAIQSLFDKKTESIGSKLSDILESVHDSLNAFATGIKVTTIVAIAAAVGILANALRKISDLDPNDIGKSLITIATMMGMLNVALYSMTKTIDKFDTKGLIKAGIAMVLIAESVNLLAKALEKIGALPFQQITKGLVGVGASLLELVVALKIIDNVKIPVSTSISMIALAESISILGKALAEIGSLSMKELIKGLIGFSGCLLGLTLSLKTLGNVKVSLGTTAAVLIVAESCKILAEALAMFGDMAWDEIVRGLTSMGVALAEVTGVCLLLGTIAGFSSLFGAGAIFIVSKGLDDIAEALAMFGDMAWDEIGRGLTAMGGALAEVTAACTIVGKIAGFSSIFGAGAILIVTQGLDDLATALKSFGDMAWDEIGRGLAAMGGALAEVSATCTIAGKIAGFSGIFGATSILIVTQGLDDLATSMKSFSEMMWDDIGRGLVAMGGALAEVSAACAIVGKIAGFSSIFGAGSILMVTQGLDELANSLSKLGDMQWDEIGRGLVAMGAALGEVGLASALTGLAGFAGLLGAGTLYTTIQSLDDLAEALKKFSSMDWDELERGLAAMGGALGETALGGIANTLGLLGALSIKAIAGPLGDLADSVKKWADVVIPPALGINLVLLADGVKEFTFGGFGASAISKVAEPLGVLANSVTKWTNVEVPEGLGDNLKALSEGVKTFTFGGFGASAISEVAEPLGTLADSVTKWKGVKVPRGISDQLKSLADGVKSFTLGGFGASAISKVAEPLGSLADSIDKWSKVTIPIGLGDNLKTLADGVKSWTWAFVGNLSISGAVYPLGALAGSISKWKDVTISRDLGPRLTSLADGVKSWTWAFAGNWSMEEAVEPLGKLADSVKKWNDVNVPSNMKTNLESLAEGVKAWSWAFLGGWSMETVAGPIGDLGEAIKKWNDVKIPDLGEKFITFKDGIVSFAKAMIDTEQVNTSYLYSLASSVNSLNTAFNNISGLDTIKVSAFSNAVSNIGSLSVDASALKETASAITSSISSMMNSVISTIQTSKPKIDSAMQIAVNGLNGIVKSTGNTLVSGELTLMMSSIVLTIQNSKSKLDNAMRTAMSGLQSVIKTINTTIVTVAISSMMSSVSTTIQNGRNSIDKAMQTATNGLPSIIKTIGNSIISSVTQLMNSMVSAINAEKNAISSAFSNVVGGAVSGIRANYNSFVAAGGYLGDGLVEGIKAEEKAAYKAGYSLGESAVQGEKDGQKSKSPSKATIQAGKWLGEGLVIGIEKMNDAVYNSGESMGETAVDSISGALSNITDAVNTGIDVKPTITPVVDMTEVKGMKDYLINSEIEMALNKPVASLSQKLVNAQSDISNGNNKVISAVVGLRDDVKAMYDMVNSQSITDKLTKEFENLRGNVSDLAESITSMKIVMDTGTVVGVLTPGIDEALGNMAVLSGRGV